MWKRKLNFLSSYLLDPINRVNKLIPGWKIHAIKLKNGRIFDSLSDKCQPLDFTTEEENYGKEMLNKFGLKDNDKFVCLAVRDGAYQLRKIPKRFIDWSYHEYRNWDIDKFILAAEELAKRGYFVFRMGVVVEKPFNSNNPKIIDYANSDLRNDFLDVYLGAKCSFCISTGLGFDYVPTIFRRPIVLLVTPVACVNQNRENVLLLYKHHVLKKEERKLSLSEIFSHGVAYALDTKIFEEKGIELVENTPEEIRDVVIEMAENLEFKIQPNSEDEELQKTFRSLLVLNNKRFILSGGLSDPMSINTAEKFAHFYGPVKLRHSTKFFRENKNWLR
jgi:putative glycosyltransferase (TIGR04372 family)